MSSPATDNSSVDRPLPPGAVRSHTLVIGCGNTLFGDDAVGPLIAETVGDLAQPGVLSRAVHELTPELAADLAATEVAIFVDASLQGEAVTCTSIEPHSVERDGLDHALTPAGLLALAKLAFGHAPQAWLVLVPGRDFELGHALSAPARQGMAEALAWIEQHA